MSASGKFNYNRFFAIGLFRLLELTGAKEPAALERLVKACGVRPENVNKDLMTYKVSGRGNTDAAGSVCGAKTACYGSCMLRWYHP